MNIDSYYKSRSNSCNTENDESKPHINQGTSMVLDQPFNIKKYINRIQLLQISAKKSKEKANLPPLYDNLYNKRTKNDEKKYEISTIIATENFPSYRKNIFQAKKPSSIEISTAFSYSNNNNNLKIKNNKNSSFSFNTVNGNNTMTYDNIKLHKKKNNEKYLKTENNSHSFDLYKKNILNNKEKFNFSKTIKNIKQYTDLSIRDKSIKAILGNKIAFDQKNKEVVYKPIRIINDFNNFQQRELEKKKDNISAFLTDNREILKNNVIMKILQNQEKKYTKNIKEYQKSISSSKRAIDYDEISFSSYTMNQKMVCRRIESLLSRLIMSNRKLIREQHKLNSELRVKKDERQKLLERIDELRIIAKFVTKVLEGNVKIFKIKIIPEYSSEHLPNYELITREVLERFYFLLNEDGIEDFKEEELLIIKEIKSLNDSEILYDQYYKIEYDIINTIKNKKAIEEDVMEIKKDSIKQCQDIQKRIDELEKELNLYKAMLEREKKDYQEMCNRNYDENADLVDVIKDLYNEVMNLENKKKANEILNLNRAVLELKKIVIDKEEIITKSISILEQYEKDNRYLFSKVIIQRKNEIREHKANVMKKLMTNEKLTKLPEEKIIFKQRKTHAPYHAPKKEKKIKIDPEIIKQIENRQLLTYE
jgi:hypothetical protein